MNAAEIKAAIEAAIPGCMVSVVENGSPSARHSLLIDSEHVLAVARFLRDDPELRFDFCSNMTAVDWLDTEVTEKVKVPKVVDGIEQEIEETRKTKVSGYLEAVYHLFSMEKKHGPVILRVRTKDRSVPAHLPSLTPVWRSAEYQEREAFDLYGVAFDGHPDMRRILMWEEFTDHPMRKDYVPPADDEAELTEFAWAMIQEAIYETVDVTGAAASATSPESEIMEISMGPHHPSTHGVFRMDVRLDGERVVRLKPVLGYLHRNHEKIAENCSYLGSIPYTDRLDYLCSMTNNWAYALAVERLTGIQVPERAEYIRVIVGELTRLQNHAGVVGFLIQDMGASGTPLMYAFREREKILDLFEALSGARMMCNYMRFGGVRVDCSVEWLQAVRRVVGAFPRFLDEFEQLLGGNEILMARTQGVGVLSRELAVNAGATGVMLRATGVNYDIRKVDDYGVYGHFKFRVPLGEHGDVYDRYMLRILEMRESLKILEQALDGIPSGPIMDPKTKLRGLRPKPGEAYARIESPKGELGFYLISDGTVNPYRYRVRPPSFIHLTVLEDMCLGRNIADVVVTLGSIDIVMGEVDR